MDDFAPISSTSIGTPVHGKVPGLTPKRKIRDRKRNKKNGREQSSMKEEGIVLDKKLLNNLAEKEDSEKGVEEGEALPEDGDFFSYGKALSRTKHRNKVDVTI
ncbi:MAG: hypothetical protein WAL98_20005 [Desulfatiglandaceae bacterium]|jgi:hypothetical protein